MDAVTATSLTSTAGSTPARQSNALTDLGSSDFLNLLITQLRTQDPLEPMGNKELLDQLSSIRDIQASTSLSETLGQLANQQRFVSASGLIGQFVTSMPGADGAVQRGVVVGIRFADANHPMLQLADGSEMAMDSVSTVESPMQAAESLIGQVVVGVDRRTTDEPTPIEGLAMSAQSGSDGDVLLELDSGQDLRLRDVIGFAPATPTTETA